MDLLGDAFVREHLGELPDRPLSLQPPVMGEGLRAQLTAEVKAAMDRSIAQAHAEINDKEAANSTAGAGAIGAEAPKGLLAHCAGVLQETVQGEP